MTLLTELAMHFGPYRIYPEQRLVLDADRPVRLGSRAMDILLILIENAGDMVSKQELMAHVWPRSVVEDGNLRVHIAALRKALGDGQAGQRYGCATWLQLCRPHYPATCRTQARRQYEYLDQP